MIKSFIKLINYLFILSSIYLLVIFINPSLKLNNYDISGICVVFSLYFILELYQDLKSRKSTIDTFIVGIDIASIILFLVFCYYSFKNYSTRDPQIIIDLILIMHFTRWILEDFKHKKS